MKQVLCYEIICPICHEIEYNPIEPTELKACQNCSSTSNFRPFTQEVLEIMLELPRLTGSRKQIIWANRIRLSALKSQSNAELLESLMEITNSHHWIEKLKDVAKLSEDEITNIIEEIRNIPEKTYMKTLQEQARQKPLTKTST